MTRRTYVYDRDLDAMVQVAGPGSNHYEEPKSGLQIMRDIEPYRTAASDVAHDNKRVVIGSRSEHRAFLRRNGLVEVGNETNYVPPPPPDTSKRDRIEAIKRAMGDYGSNVRDYS